MPERLKKTFGLRILLLALLGLIGLLVIGVLSRDVATKLRQLNSANSDNVQWSLTQAEVDYLEFASQLNPIAALPSDAALGELRRKFDVFYSRIATLDKASLYAPLRATAEFSADLQIVQSFLERSVNVIDADDAILIAALPDMKRDAQPLRAHVRSLATYGLTFFAKASDNRRAEISRTLFQLACVVGFLLVAMIILALYLAALNRQNIRRRAEVTEAGERMKTITDTALDAVIVSDNYGRILTFNAAAEQIFGYRAEEAIGQDLGALIIPDHLREAHRLGMERMRRGGERQITGQGRVQLDAKRATGALFPAEFAIQSAVTPNGEIFIAFLRDISQRRQAEEELVHARDRALAGEKAKTDFLATMSHEIRTPLNGLLGNLALLEDTDLSARQARYIKYMNTSGKLLMRHISDVLDLTKYDAGKLQLRPEPMEIGLLLQDIVDNQSGAAARNATTIAWGWRSTPVEWINADHDRIQHILMNIVGNAVKFTRSGEVRIEISISPDAPSQAGKEAGGPIRHELCIRVTDTGLGMGPDLQTRIFDDFTTGDAAYDRSVGGTGLGLGIAQRFAKALGGAITVTSTLGKGSCFTIRFPVEPISPPESAPLLPTAPPQTAPPQSILNGRAKTASSPRHNSPLPFASRAQLQGDQAEEEDDPLRDAALDAAEDAARGKPARTLSAHRILLVEDNGINRVVAREMLRSLGHSVTEVHNGREAVDIALERPFDLILMDISMPLMDGRAATRAIRASAGPNAKAPIIALTANAMEAEQRAYLADGMNDILTKPLMRAGLKRIVEAHIPAAGSAPPPTADKPIISGQTASPAQSVAQSATKSAAEIDPTHLEELRESLGQSTLSALIARHCAEIETEIDQLQSALPLPEIAARAHRIAGSAAALGAFGLREALITVEQAAKAARPEDLARARAELVAVWAVTHPALASNA